MFEMLSGTTPFTAATRELVVQRVLHDEVDWHLLPEDTGDDVRDTVVVLCFLCCFVHMYYLCILFCVGD